MPAVVNQIVARDADSNLLAKREESWAQQEVGVIVVFCIVGIVGTGLITLFIYKKIIARKAARGQ